MSIKSPFPASSRRWWHLGTWLMEGSAAPAAFLDWNILEVFSSLNNSVKAKTKASLVPLKSKPKPKLS